jgi:CHRD domain/PEP-CTERM motif
MLRLRPLWLVPIAFLFATAQSQAAVINFTAVLTGDQEVPPNPSAATGFATFQLNDAHTALTFKAVISGIDVTGLQTADDTDNLLAAHIHAPGPPGGAGGVVWGFFGMPFNDNDPMDIVVSPFATGAGGTFTGKWDLNEGNMTTLALQLPNLLNGLAYINFHTGEFRGGEIRGQIVPLPEPTSITLLGLGLLGLGSRLYRRR